MHEQLRRLLAEEIEPLRKSLHIGPTRTMKILDAAYPVIRDWLEINGFSSESVDSEIEVLPLIIPHSVPQQTEEQAFSERWEYHKELNLWVHAEGTCIGKNCSIHDPSDHPLKDARRNWRGDRNLMERICSHGVGHPDPDDIAYHKLLEADPDTWDDPDPTGRGIHGCCAERCCSTKA